MKEGYRVKRESLTVLVAFLAIIVILRAQAPTARQLVKVGGIAAENGEFAILNNLVTAYSDGDVRVTVGKADDWETMAGRGSVSYEVNDSGLRSVKDTAPSAAAHEFQFCDSFDQVSRPVGVAFRAVLPKDAKVKAVEDYSDGRTLAVYTVPGTDHYRIDISLIESTPSGGYSVAGNLPVTEYGDYCGMVALTREIRAVLVDEPAGSSDYSAAYFFAVRPRKPHGQ